MVKGWRKRSVDEESAIRQCFTMNIERKVLPLQHQILNAIQCCHVLASREVQSIKYKVKNEMTRKKDKKEKKKEKQKEKKYKLCTIQTIFCFQYVYVNVTRILLCTFPKSNIFDLVCHS